MSEKLPKQQLWRFAWTTAMRTQGHRQCHGMGRDGSGGACVMELLREITGSPKTWNYARVGLLIGLTYEQTLEAICRNDGRAGFRKHTFNELADVVDLWVVEGWLQ